MEGILFNIQRYSIHDGGGIRTLVFFKGCPLRCPWCCNPESQEFGIQIKDADKGYIRGKYCRRYKEASIEKMEIGQKVAIDEIIKEVEKDRVFYKTSNGGVTLSGGEVLSQAKFAIELAKELQKLGTNVAIETSGMGKTEDILELGKNVDTVLFDLKIIDQEKCHKVLKGDSSLILTNLKELVSKGIKVIPRIPLIPSFTMTEKNLEDILKIILELGFKEIHILPFHQYGSGKYEYLNRDYNLKELKPPTKEEIELVKKLFTNHGIEVVVGGD